MGKIDEYASGRNDGLQLALKIVEEDGVDALREEIKFRGAKAYLSRDVADGFYFGWSAGCPRYCHYDGIHGTTIDTAEEDCYAVHGANSKEEAVEKWNNRVEHLKERDQQIGYEKIFEEMQMNSLR